jgi:hypothetical protein
MGCPRWGDFSQLYNWWGFSGSAIQRVNWVDIRSFVAKIRGWLSTIKKQRAHDGRVISAILLSCWLLSFHESV